MHLTFGEWLRDQRKNAGMNQKSLAERVGLTQAQLSRLESGLQKASADVAAPLLKTLNVDPLAAAFWLERMDPVRAPTPKPTLYPSLHPAVKASKIQFSWPNKS